jgi:hypothetical protein
LCVRREREREGGAREGGWGRGREGDKKVGSKKELRRKRDACKKWEELGRNFKRIEEMCLGRGGAKTQRPCKQEASARDTSSISSSTADAGCANKSRLEDSGEDVLGT